jgi:hypothetical protein
MIFVDLVQFIHDRPHVIPVVLVMLLVGIEAVETIAVALERKEIRGAAHPCAASLTCFGDAIDVNTLGIIADVSSPGAQMFHFFLDSLPGVSFINFNSAAANLFFEVVLDVEVAFDILLHCLVS